MKRSMGLFGILGITLSILSGLLTGCSENSTRNPFDYARIVAVDYTAVVVDEPDSKGKVIVTERLTFDIHAASENNRFWELWRDLPEEDVDGARVTYKEPFCQGIFSNMFISAICTKHMNGVVKTISNIFDEGFENFSNLLTFCENTNIMRMSLYVYVTEVCDEWIC